MSAHRRDESIAACCREHQAQGTQINTYTTWKGDGEGSRWKTEIIQKPRWLDFACSELTWWFQNSQSKKVSKRRKISSVQSCRSTQAWLWEVGFVFGERGGCEMWSWALQTAAEPQAGSTVLTRRQGGADWTSSSHRLCIRCWQCFHSILFKEGAFWPDLTSKKFKSSKFVKVCLLKSYYKTVLIKTMWYEWKQWKKKLSMKKHIDSINILRHV